MLARNTLLLILGHAANWLGIILGQTIVAHQAGIDGLGRFCFLAGLFTLLSLVFDYGYGPAASREVALAADPTVETRLFGALAHVLVAPAVHFVLAAMLVVLVASWLAGWELLVPGLVGALCGWGFLLRGTLSDALTARRDMHLLAVVTGGPPLAFAIIACLLGMTGQVTLLTAFVAYAATTTLTCVLLLARASYGATATDRGVGILRRARRAYGQSVWIGRVVSTGGFILDTPILGFACSPQAVGYYSMTKSVCNPFGVLAATFSRTMFRSMAVLRSIPRTVQGGIWAFNLAGGLLLVALGPLVAHRLYGADQDTLLLPVRLQAIAAAITGIYSIYNTYLGARGCGDALRRGGIAFGLLAVLVNFTLIPLLAEVGACIGNLGCGAFWLCYCLRACRQCVLPPKQDRLPGESEPPWSLPVERVRDAA